MFDDLFSLSGLSLDRLKSFAEIVAAGSITAAAKDDSNKQSQLSRQLKELERYFGVELIKRGHGRMRLTEPGERLQAVINHAFGSLEEFRRQCRRAPVELNIGAGEGVIQWLVLPRLSDFLSLHPNVTVSFENLRNDDIHRAVSDGALDFGLVTRLKATKALAAARLGKLEYRLFAPARLLRGSQKPSVQLLAQLPLAMLRGSETIRGTLHHVAEKHGFDLNVRLCLSSYPQLAAAVQELNVAAVMPAIAAAALTSGEVRSIRLPVLDVLAREAGLIWNQSTADVRPTIVKYGKVLSEVFRVGASSREAS